MIALRKKLFFFFTLMILPCFCFSYIPSAKTILSRAVKRHGSGIYEIEQEVSFPNEATNLGLFNNFTLREVWLIESEDSMHLTVTGTREWKKTIFFEYLYKKGHRYSIDSSKKNISHEISSDFIENFFHYRSLEKFAHRLKKQNILPPSFLMNSYEPSDLSETGYVYEPFSRLTRVSGVVAYGYGTPSTQKNLLPGAWIEQDHFVLRKLRLKSGAEITSSSFSQYSKNLYFPKIRYIQWHDRQYKIQLISVKNKTSSKILKNKFSTENLNQPTKIEGLQNAPNKNLILNFYRRFR